jgi:hypothetical protein
MLSICLIFKMLTFRSLYFVFPQNQSITNISVEITFIFSFNGKLNLLHRSVRVNFVIL